jgi:hypothetical protein
VRRLGLRQLDERERAVGAGLLDDLDRLDEWQYL